MKATPWMPKWNKTMTFKETANRTFQNHEAQLLNAKAVRKRLHGVVPVKPIILPQRPVIALVDDPIAPPERDLLMLSSTIEPNLVSYTVHEIKLAVSALTGVTMIELESHLRPRRITDAKKLCYYLARKHTTYSTPMIGKYLGNRDHTTVLHGVKSVKNNMRFYASIIKLIEARMKTHAPAQR